MKAPLLLVEHQETWALVANAVRVAYFERFGELLNPSDWLWERGTVQRLNLIADVELKLGVAFRDEDIEFLDTPEDLIERGVAILLRGGR
jgi:hypothetical protein